MPMKGLGDSNTAILLKLKSLVFAGSFIVSLVIERGSA